MKARAIIAPAIARPVMVRIASMMAIIGQVPLR
jgi:hypothetical protein